MADQPSDGQFQPVPETSVIEGAEIPVARHHNRRPWTAEEDEQLRKQVARLGTNAWHEMEAYIPNRSARQCRERWNQYLSPDVENSPWSPEDDQLLLSLFQTLGNKWTMIAHQFPKRTANSIKNRIKIHMRRLRKEGKQIDPPEISFGPSDVQVPNLSSVLVGQPFDSNSLYSTSLSSLPTQADSQTESVLPTQEITDIISQTHHSKSNELPGSSN